MTEWIIDSVVGFLRSPMWVVPILTFIEEQSIIFDPGVPENEEYKVKHGEYRNLVGLLMNSYLEDMNLKQEEFIKACEDNTSKSSVQYHQGLFEQIWAADDYEVFKRMMTQKNVELELQVLQQIQERNGVVPESLKPGPESSTLFSVPYDKSEEEILNEVLRISKEEFEREKGKKQDKKRVEEDALERAIAYSNEEKLKLEEKALHEQELLDKAVKLSVTEKAPVTLAPSTVTSVIDTGSSHQKAKKAAKFTTSQQSAELKNLPPVSKPVKAAAGQPEKVAVEQPPVSKSSEVKKSTIFSKKSGQKKKDQDAQQNDSSKQKKQLVNLPKEEAVTVKTSKEKQTNLNSASGSESPQLQLDRTSAASSLSQDEIKRRAEYLRQQRDKLVAMKKEERAKRLINFEGSQSKERPKSSRAAQSVIANKGGQPAVDEKTLAMRVALAQKLKQEVVGRDVKS